MLIHWEIKIELGELDSKTLAIHHLGAVMNTVYLSLATEFKLYTLVLHEIEH